VAEGLPRRGWPGVPGPNIQISSMWHASEQLAKGGYNLAHQAG
jgi:hypothetical protein